MADASPGCSDCPSAQATPADSLWARGKDSPGYAQVIGNNYINFGTAGGRPIFSVLRSPNTPQKASVSLDVTDAPVRPATATKMVGAFSGKERYYDFGAAGVAGSFADNAAIRTAAFGGAKGFVTIVPGGGANGGSPDNWNLIKANGAKYFKDFVYAMAVTLNSGPYFSKNPIATFEVGNEVNAIGQFNVLGVANEKDRQYTPEKQARGYVDAFLAPAVEGLRKASMDLFGDPRRLVVVSAGIATAYSPDSAAFIDTFMNMTPSTSALTAPIKTQIDILGVHYTMRFPLKPGKNLYGTTYDQLKKKWVDTGTVKGIWGTEEGGDHGRGAYDALLSSFRYIHWWSQRGWSGLPLGGKLIWFGENNWFDFKLVQAMLVDLWGGATARQLDITDHLALPDANLEGYALANASAGDWRIAVVIASNEPAVGPSRPFPGFSLKDIPTGLDPSTLTIDAHRVYATILDEQVNPPVPNGQAMTMESLVMTKDAGTNSLNIRAAKDIVLGADDLLFITIQPPGPAPRP
jgi:hypothetical protein